MHVVKSLAPSDRPEHPRVLCVDDEPNVLEAMEPHLRKHFSVFTARGGAEALEVLGRHGPFAVVVSDMRMPGMNGAELLGRVRAESPDTVRVLLTGHADMASAISAVNEGGVYRYLTKPCQPRELVSALEEAARRYDVLQAERKLLQETLTGAVTVLTEVLSLVHGEVVGRAHRTQRWVGRVGTALGLADVWELELAAALARLGHVGVPTEVLRKAGSGVTLSATEARMLADAPSVAARLVNRIPRLEGVARMVGGQGVPTTEIEARSALERGDRCAVGAHVLRAVLELEKRLDAGQDPQAAIAAMRVPRHGHSPPVLDALRGLFERDVVREVVAVDLDDLRPGMVLVEDVRTRRGALVVPRGNEITPAVKERLLRFADGVGVEEPIRVLMPVDEEAG